MADAIEFLMTNPEAEESGEGCPADKSTVEDRQAPRLSARSSKDVKFGALSKKELRKLAKNKSSAPATEHKSGMRDSGFIVV